ncbi:autolysis histidine kinase LytS [Gracilibacillus boraciitolerans JCM 21714]|uniref:Autolysis histidine kinase LytS n=1 Tax=Gracilibacillus boraciitolerans JCM 21714 TaxID=1298598 RepID=W4VI07_9BACI|nr:LytS/YhcK type 5TM receptor domain-containing protein [Gracilibacillus boraciitolerans]GAE92394.1 autolysis histidine kinase LytS [Gracilibacillus boraciitolerans JCM 21714]
MIDLTIVLFERIGLLLLAVFMLTQVPGFRSLLDRDMAIDTVIYLSVVFGIIGILGIHTGVLIQIETMVLESRITDVSTDEVLIGFSMVVVMIAGLLGGPYVGLGAGVITSFYLSSLGGEAWIANSLINPLAGLITGWTGQFFSEERVIAPEKALFIGMFPPVLHMGMLLIFISDQQTGVELVNTIGIPLVVTNAIALAIFTMMIRAALNETEREAAIETNRALSIAEKALPLLQDASLISNADKMATLLYNELDVAAIAVTNKERVLSHVGLGDDHHRQGGEPLKMRLSQKALNTGNIQVAYDRGDIQCRYDPCPLKTAIMIPVFRSGEIIGLINLYYRNSQQIRAVEIELAKGLGTIISNQISGGVEVERMKELLKEAEIRNLQAQINPHFLFNTFNLLHSLMRVNQEKARHILIQLSQYMRANLTIASKSLISLGTELEHVNAYVEIVTARFMDQLIVKKTIDQKLEDVRIPPATLQPLIENCIQHGLKDKQMRGTIELIIKREKDWVYIEVKDNGIGFSEDRINLLGTKPLEQTQGSGTALYNINERLKGIIGGGESCLHFRNLPDKGSSVSFKLPISKVDIPETATSKFVKN